MGVTHDVLLRPSPGSFRRGILGHSWIQLLLLAQVVGGILLFKITVFSKLSRQDSSTISGPVYCRSGEANTPASSVPTISSLYFRAGHAFVLLLDTPLFA